MGNTLNKINIFYQPYCWFMGCLSHTDVSKDYIYLDKRHNCNFKSYVDTRDYTLISNGVSTGSYKSTDFEATDSDEEFIEFSEYLVHDKIDPI